MHLRTFVARGLFLGIALTSMTIAHAQYVDILNSPDTPTGGLSDMNLKTLLTNAGIGSYIYSTPALNGGFATDQITERAFIATSGFVPQIDVLFTDNQRKAAAGYQPYHRIGWYQRDAGTGAPAESAIKDVVWEASAEAAGNTNNRKKLTTTSTDFASLNRANPFELRLTSATQADSRSGSIYGNDLFNPSSFRNVAYFKERNLAGDLIADSYIIAWEDLRGGGDKDYNDMAIRVKYVRAVGANPVPEPTTLAFVVLTVLGTGVIRRRKTKYTGR